MKLFPEGRSKGLSAASLAAAAVSGLMALKASYDFSTLIGVFSTPALYLSMVGSKVPYGMPPLAVLLTRNIRLAFFFALVFWCSVCALAAGVWLRREWARRGAVWGLYLLSAAALLLLLYPWLAVPRPLYYAGIPIAPEFNAAVLSAAAFARILALLAGGVCLWWALALDRSGLKSEFR
ncbi:MAG: hypothetical protein A2049_01835 [Elusimicrobia bacterium GWA2_62_23]|nr:MAG: hypothetical protein A2049_01835 [Elusimicrobia bacterium GWA2_62_23]